MSEPDDFTPVPDADELDAALSTLRAQGEQPQIDTLEGLREVRTRPPFTISGDALTMDDLVIPGPDGTRLGLRACRPAGPARAVLIDVHGGGWSFGAASDDDWLNSQYVTRCQVATVSVDYRLAPESPFPAAVDDCLAAARWVASNAISEFGTNNLLLHGMSSGAHLAALALLALRDEDPETANHIRGASLDYGVYDIGGTPSHRQADRNTPVLPAHWLRAFIGHTFAGCPPDLRQSPAASPLFADLRELPPALFTVGALDPLLDDSLFMASRWRAAGNHTDLDVWPGGVHGISNSALTPNTAEAILRRTAGWFDARLPKI